ncbi:Iron-sulfur cluster-binding protein [Olavius algarvensis associated proteobacterium Delta 3]|nr:Iron-sulfur cluster-binding protein [Olavius algarvensis associated proteobacterium Delta 3]
MHKVMIHPADYDHVRDAVKLAFDLFPVPIRGKKVLIKPNVLRASEAAEAIVTHPAVLRAVVAQVASMEPESLVVGDNPGLFNYGANEECFEKTGLMAAAGEYYRNIGDDSVGVEFNPEFMPSVSLSRAILEADIIISLPKFKTHGLTVMTGAIKNSYGFLPGAQKARLHRAAGSPERFHDLVVDVFRLRVPDLFIVDAVVGMEGNGPASPDVREIGLILASNNGVALDGVIATMMGLDPARLRFLEKAREAGLGDYAMDRITIVGELKMLPDFKLPPLGGDAVTGNEAIQELIRGRAILRPKADPESCTACGTCIDQCPVEALSMIEDLPEVDPDICISCFCCQEICPEKAIALA